MFTRHSSAGSFRSPVPNSVASYVPVAAGTTRSPRSSASTSSSDAFGLVLLTALLCNATDCLCANSVALAIAPCFTFACFFVRPPAGIVRSRVLSVQFSNFLYTGWPAQYPHIPYSKRVRVCSPPSWHAMQPVTCRSIQVVCTWVLCLHLFAAMASMAGPSPSGPDPSPVPPAPVRRFVCVHCTATSHLSSRGLFLHRSAVLRHIRGSKPCFAADLGFKEIHVEARAGDVMAGAGGAAGPAPDVRHQPPGKV